MSKKLTAAEKKKRQARQSYRQVYQPTHHRADITGWVSQHLLLMEKYLGRPLEKGEVVHHLDHNKLNNTEENLCLCDRASHQRVPEFQSRFLREKGLLQEFKSWWFQHRDDIFPTEVLQQQLVAAEMKLAKAKQRAAKNA